MPDIWVGTIGQWYTATTPVSSVRWRGDTVSTTTVDAFRYFYLLPQTGNSLHLQEMDMHKDLTRRIVEHERLWNTMGQTSDPRMTGYRHMMTHWRWSHDEDLRLEVETQREQRGRCILWLREYRNRITQFRHKVADQMRPTHTGRWAGFYAPSQAKAWRESGAAVRRSVRELRAWAAGKNPGCSLDVMAPLLCLPARSRAKALPTGAEEAYLRWLQWECSVRYNENAFQSPVWHDGSVDYLDVHHRTLCRVSDEDPMQVCYIQNVTKLMHGEDGMWTRTKPGRFLTKFLPDLSELEVKRWAERHEQMHKPLEVFFVENTDPDGWEWVYENASGFTSCMQYDRCDRYLHSQACGEDHPVRNYAYPDNGLRLAWIGDKDKGEVWGRALVRDEPGCKGYIRIYGDDRLKKALERYGYGQAVSLEGVKIARRVVEWGGNHLYLIPYLDSVCLVSDEGKYLLITSSGMISGTSSSGTVYCHSGSVADEDEDEGYVCPRCGAHHDDEDDIHYSDYEDENYCPSCDDDFVYAVVSTGRYGHNHDMVLRDNAIEVYGGWYVYDESVLHDAGFERCEECNEWERVYEMTGTSRGLICECTPLVELDRDDYEGNSYAHPDDVVRAIRLLDGEEVWMHEDDFNSEGQDDDEEYVQVGTTAHEEYLAEQAGDTSPAEEDEAPATSEPEPFIQAA